MDARESPLWTFPPLNQQLKLKLDAPECMLTQHHSPNLGTQGTYPTVYSLTLSFSILPHSNLSILWCSSGFQNKETIQTSEKTWTKHTPTLPHPSFFYTLIHSILLKLLPLWQLYGYRHAVNRFHGNILLSIFSSNFVLKYAAKILKSVHKSVHK